jgi:L-aspartate oxidase
MQLKKYDVIIVGTGLAGLYTAVNLDRKLRVLMLSKRELDCSNSALAQGGIAAAFGDIESHIADTLKAGHYRNNRENVRIMVENSDREIENLKKLGVIFDDDLHKEGGHGKNRIAHCKDETGFSIVTALQEKVKTFENIDILENSCLLDLQKKDYVFFARISTYGNSAVKLCCTAKICILATGGIGCVYKYTTNSNISTGDGIYFACKLGAKVENMSRIQFHPTAFAGKTSDNRRLLITEAVRGEGGKLLNKNMTPFTDELQPRDTVSRAVLAEEKRLGGGIFLSVTHLEPDIVKAKFPMINEKLSEYGYDMTTQPVPVYPCQHYHMGGISVDCKGRTCVNGLFAVGECACTGVHGNNRLASNSLLEAVVFSRLAAEVINAEFQENPTMREFTDFDYDCECEEIGTENITDEFAKSFKQEIRAIMQKSFFVEADFIQARTGLARINEIRRVLEEKAFAQSTVLIELKSLAFVSYLVLREVLSSDS